MTHIHVRDSITDCSLVQLENGLHAEANAPKRHSAQETPDLSVSFAESLSIVSPPTNRRRTRQAGSLLHDLSARKAEVACD